MIPRIIHYASFCDFQQSDLNRRCIETWRRVLPDYKLREWTSDNGPHGSKYFHDAILKQCANAANYIRLWALYHYGGIYLDQDMEVLRPFDLDLPAFVGFQRDDSPDDCINGAAIGAEAGNPFIKRCLDLIEQRPGDDWPVYSGCTLLTEELRRSGMVGLNQEQRLKDVMVYDKERLYPFFHNEPHEQSRATDRTFAIHWWQGTWISGS